MRDFKGMKRQRGRNNRGGGGGKPQQHNANRAFDSNGPDGVKVRGAAQSVYEKYQQLARDASSSGDRVLAENYLQHAEHYFRVLRAIQPNRSVSDIIGKDAYSAYEIDFEAEPEEVVEAPAAVETPAEGAEGGEGGEGQGEQRRDRNRDRFENRDRDRNRDDRPRDGQGQGEQRRDRWRDRDDRDRSRDDRPRDDRPRDDRPRDDRPRDDRPRDDRPREDRFRDRDDRPRDDRPRDDRPREERQPREERPAAEGGEFQGEAREGRRSRRDRDRDRNRDRDRGERDPLAVIEPEAAPLGGGEASVSESSPVLRGQDGAVSHAPAFLGRKSEPKAKVEAEAAPAAETAAAPAPEAAGEEVKKPRRRRAPRSFEGGDAPASESEEA